VATTKDFATVRDSVLFFLQSHLKKIPKGLDPEEARSMERRRKMAVRTMEDMSVLDIAAGAGGAGAGGGMDGGMGFDDEL
jgi:hypothetical protein